MRFGQIAVLVAAVSVFCLGPAPSMGQNVKQELPSAAAVDDLLRKEPITLQTWPAWRARLLAWIGDRSRRADTAFKAAWTFIQSQADAQGSLPPALAKDQLAWYFLGSAYLYEESKTSDPIQSAAKAEKALRRSLELDPGFARAHRNLAMAILFQAPRGQADPRAQEVNGELREAGRLDPELPLNLENGRVAFVNQQFAEAEKFFQKVLRETPDDLGIAMGLAMAVVQNRQRPGPVAPRIQELVDRFPNSGELACVNSLALGCGQSLRRRLPRAGTRRDARSGSGKVPGPAAGSRD